MQLMTVARFENMAALHPLKLSAMYVYRNPVLACLVQYIFD